jgi:hypothetical protein
MGYKFRMKTTNIDQTETIVAMDLLSYSASHVPINSFWLRSLSRFFKIEVIVEASHMDEVCRDLKCSFGGRRIKRGKFWRARRELIFLKELFRQRNKNMLIMGATGSQILVLSLFERVFKKGSERWSIVLHSELEGVVEPSGIMKKCSYLAFNLLGFPKNLKAIVLGEHIIDSLHNIKIPSSNIYSIEHPLPHKIETNDFVPDGPIKSLAIIGLLRGDTKDLEQADRLAKNSNLDIYFIGRRGPSYVKPSVAREKVLETHYSFEWMGKELENIDALYICPRSTKYKFTALGSISDALLFSKPVCWIKHDALKAYEDAPFSIVGEDEAELLQNLSNYIAPEAIVCEQWVNQWNNDAELKILDLYRRGAVG